MADMSILDKTYNSSFTPDHETESSKTCLECRKILPPGKFKCRKGSRDGVSGIIRNGKCRRCEASTTLERKGLRTLKMETNIGTLGQEIDNLRNEFIEVIKVLREDIDLGLNENRKLRREIEDLRDLISNNQGAIVAKSSVAPMSLADIARSRR